MNNIQLFSNPKFGNVRAVEIEGKPYFVGRDVAICLGYIKPENAIAQHVDKEDTLKQGIPDSQGFMQTTTVINESGVYSLVFGSKLPSAKEFKRWVTKDVLPSIRKHGGYIIEKEDDTEDDLLARAFLIAQNKLKEREQRINQLEQTNESKTILINELSPKATYYDNTLMSGNTMTTTQIAKELGMSGVTLNKKLHDKGVQYKVGKQWVLYAKYEDRDYTKTSTYTEIIDGESRTFVSTVWTQKGREFIHKMMGVLEAV